MADVFTSEEEFEKTLVDNLATRQGWTGGILKYKSAQDLLNNWAKILFENNDGIDRLNGCPLTDGEMQQILEQVKRLRTPLRLNGLIKGKTISVVRDNPDDAVHFGKEVSLDIFNRMEIAGGKSRYQIAEQTQLSTGSDMKGERRADVMLLINGMPLIHLELKKSGVDIMEACHQFERYMNDGVFTGIFSLVQVFVAMKPDETLYFANPGPDGSFDSDYYFHWADFNNEPVNKWEDIAKDLLSIPMAHQLVGSYTVADDSDGILKVMRSYQYYAVATISDRVKNVRWGEGDVHGGYIWHTTGSGKTMTSFKAAQLIADSGDADKVVFLMDRVELGVQSLREYRNFADDSESVQATGNTDMLKAKLKSTNPADTLIVTSIQKMSNIREDDMTSAADFEQMRSKRIVLIVDECHRSTFGEMMGHIRQAFPDAMFFGFTGTPIKAENKKKGSTTAMVFGNELHHYSIADGIRDGNVLGFDPYMVLTYKDRDVRKLVALKQEGLATEDEVYSDPIKTKAFQRYMNEWEMAGHEEKDGTYARGIEDLLPLSQYNGTDGTGNPEHFKMVVDDIADGWQTISSNGKFNALLATSSIPQAISYYRLIKEKLPRLKVTALFDSNIDNTGGAAYKEDGLIEVLEDYNARFGTSFTIPTHAGFKKDVVARLAQKKPYIGINRMPEKKLDLVIVVDQLLTGFDSKWLNALYLDKVLENESIIQAFSRTNRLFDKKDEKQFGTIRYYRKPHTMERNVREAVKLYSGEGCPSLFVDKLEENLEHMNQTWKEIVHVFEAADVTDLERLPDSVEACAKFAKLFKDLHSYLEMAKVQGFTWGKSVYTFKHDSGEDAEVEMAFCENDYLTLAQRYKELARDVDVRADHDDIPFALDGYLTEIDTGHIDVNYMNANFTKWLKKLKGDETSQEELDCLLDDIHRSFGTLTQEQQRIAETIIHTAQRGDLNVRPSMSFMDYITESQAREKDDQIRGLVDALGVDEGLLRKLLGLHVTERDINEYGRLDNLERTIDQDKARAFFEARAGQKVPSWKVRMWPPELLRRFILKGGFDVRTYDCDDEETGEHE